MANDRWFQKRHYDVLAAEIARTRHRVRQVNAMRGENDQYSLFPLQLLEEGLNETLTRDNPNFDPDRFSKACQP